MRAEPATPVGDIAVRDVLSSLAALQALSLAMADSPGEDEIVGLAVCALWSLTRSCRAEAVWLDGEWRPLNALRQGAEIPAAVEAQIAGLGSAGGALEWPGIGWARAFPLSSRGGASGYLVVGAPEQPLEQEWSLIQALAHQTGMALAQTRLLDRERAIRARIVDEQATLRRLGNLVARTATPEEVFATVAAEAGRLLDTDFAVMSRYTGDGSATVVGAWAKAGDAGPLPPGARLEPGGRTVHSLVFETGEPARIEDYGDEGIIARQWSLRSVVGAPIHLGGRLWGVIGVASRRDEPLPADTEAWLAGFIELVATTVASAHGRMELRVFAEEEAALRRVATLVARAAPPAQVFAAVTEEVGQLLGADITVLCRYESGVAATILGMWVRADSDRPPPIGLRFELGGHNVHTLVAQTRRPARVDSSEASGQAADEGHSWGVRSAVGVPINVEDRLWGVVTAASTREEPPPADTGARLAHFAELVGTALANAQAREELRSVADEQSALRRVATLVARAAPPEEVFAAVAEEAGRLLEGDYTVLSRYEPDGAIVVVGGWARIDPGRPLAIGTRLQPGGQNLHTLVWRTSRPARIDSYGEASGPAANVARNWGFGSAVGAPISVEGRLWGVVSVATTREQPFPADSEQRLAGFTELVGTALANAEARVELRGVGDEQAALRRVATLVAEAASPEDVFAAVSEEVGRLLGADFTFLGRHEPDDAVTVLGAWARADPTLLPVGVRMEPSGHNVHTLVFRSGRPARIDDQGDAADLTRDWVVRSAVGAPISVEGRLWGVISVALTGEQPLPVGTEERLAAFTELIGTAVANAEAQTALTTSRARIVAAADTARRRIERDLHDGAQQHLVSLALQLRAVQAVVPADDGDLAAQLDGVAVGLGSVLDELRELAGGIHPASLARGGLGQALKTLARRSAVPVRHDLSVDGRLPEPIELAAYYVVAEALANAAKHAGATVIDVQVAARPGVLWVSVRDNGRGGADPTHGSGLVGLTDRIEALGGRMWLHSPPGGGTTVEVALPLGEGS